MVTVLDLQRQAPVLTYSWCKWANWPHQQDIEAITKLSIWDKTAINGFEVTYLVKDEIHTVMHGNKHGSPTDLELDPRVCVARFDWMEF